MTGTEKIKAKILEDARGKAFNIEEQAKLEAHGILDTASKTAEQKRAELLRKAESEGAEVYRRLIAVAGLEGRKELLRAKQDMVETAFKTALGKVTGLPDQEYQKFLEELVAGAAVKGSGEILLSEKDSHRIDSHFPGNISKRLNNKGLSGDLTLSCENIQTTGGVVLRYGEMEINSTLEIIFGMLRTQLENDVVKILFST